MTLGDRIVAFLQEWLAQNQQPLLSPQWQSFWKQLFDEVQAYIEQYGKASDVEEQKFYPIVFQQ